MPRTQNVHGASASGRLCRLNCGLVRDRGIDLTSITRSTPDFRKRSANSTIVLVEWPMVKKVFVSSLQWTKPRDDPALPRTLSARFQNQKRQLSAKCRDFEEPIDSAAGGCSCP